MSDEIKDQVNPEEYWPAAEQLLDQHFQQKKRRRAAWLFALLLLCTSVGVWTFYKQGGPTVIKLETVPAIHLTVVHANSPTQNTVDNSPVAQEKQVEISEKSTKEYPKTTGMQLHTVVPEKANSTVAINTSHPSPRAIRQPHKQSQVDVSNQPSPAAVTPADAQATVAEEQVADAEAGALFDVSMLNSLPASFTTATDFSLAGIPTPETSKHEKKPFILIVYGGAASVGKTIDNGNGKVYLQRRSKEEEKTILPFAGFQVSKNLGKVDVRIGLEAATLGEKLNYSPYSIGEYFNTHGEWQPYQRTVTHVDSTYIYGVMFTHTTTSYVTDSTYITVTDTLNGTHYDSSITAANGINRRMVVEIPVEAVWQISRGRLGIGIMGGIAPGWLVKSTGHYLLPDESGTGDLSKDSKQQFTLNVRAGVELSYLLNEQMRILLRPAARFYLLDVDEKTGAGSKYHSYGVSAGVSYFIR